MGRSTLEKIMVIRVLPSAVSLIRKLKIAIVYSWFFLNLLKLNR